MLNKMIVVRTCYYNYFGGQKDRTKQFDSLVDAWSYYKEQTKNTFDYGDAFYSVQRPSVYWVFKKPNTHNIGHTRPRHQHNGGFSLSTDILSYILDIPDVDDEDIII